MGRRGAGRREDGRGWPRFIGIFLFAFGFRFFVSSSLSHLGLWQSPQFDAHENLAWAHALAAGEFQWPSPPTHGPAYPFLLALLLKVFGTVSAARVAQAALASATCVLAARTGELLFERRAGLAAGVLLAVSGPVALVDVSFWEEGFVSFLLSAALLLLVARRTPAFAGASGLLLGIACAARPTAVLFVLAALAFVLFLEGSSRPGPTAAALLLGVAVVLLPAVIGSSRAAGHFVFVRAYGAVNLWIGNDPAGGGVQNARPNGPWDRLAAEPARAGVAPKDEEAWFTRRAIERATADPVGLARVVLSKLAWLTQAEEPRDNHAFAFFASQSGILRILPGFGLLFAMAAAAFFARLPLRTAGLPLLWIVAGVLPFLAALAGLRYRMPVVPAVALFAGAGAAHLLDRVKKRDLRLVAAPAVVVALTLCASHVRRHPPSHVFAEEWALEGNAWMELGKPAEAERTLRRAVEADPKAALPVEFLGRLRLAQGRAAEAADTFEESLRMDPDSRSAHFFLGQAREALGLWPGAASAYRAALAISPAFFPAQFHLGRALLLAGDPAGAVAALEKAVALQPLEQPPRELLEKARALALSPR
ncbi:MAG TPA: tetratricopeptide repeat protein [Thermoanaerobaculia bacterium]|nr:tetratricopeptide repeat protein [Thermoanaerobaculia bacterium]